MAIPFTMSDSAMMKTIISAQLPRYLTNSRRKGWVCPNPVCGLSVLRWKDHTEIRFAPFTRVKFTEKRETVKIQIMIGAIIGDIVGSRFEFKNHLSTDFQLFAKDCSFTDDTICTVAITDALLKGISFEQSLRYWCLKYPTPKGSYGGSFAAWLHSPNPMPYNSFGNGSAMRVSPCAWFSNDREIILKKARESAECTHDHPEGIRGAMCVADCIYHARLGSGMFKIIELVTKEYGYSLDMTCDSIRKTNTFNETCQVTVPQAIVCFMESTNFESAIRLAVSIGGDSDTIAAITGSIAEAFYKDIPKDVFTTAFTYLPQEMLDVIYNFHNHLNRNNIK